MHSMHISCISFVLGNLSSFLSTKCNPKAAPPPIADTHTPHRPPLSIYNIFRPCTEQTAAAIAATPSTAHCSDIEAQQQRQQQQQQQQQQHNRQSASAIPIRIAFLLHARHFCVAADNDLVTFDLGAHFYAKAIP